MNEGQSGNGETVQTVLFTYSKPKSKKENGQRIPFYRNSAATSSRASLHQSRVMRMKKNFENPRSAANTIKSASRPHAMPSRVEVIESETKPTKKCEESNISFHSVFDDSWFPDDLELSFHNGQLDNSKLDLSICSMVPDIDSARPENIAQQNFYELNVPSKSDAGTTRKRTYRDFPDFTYKKTCLNK